MKIKSRRVVAVAVLLAGIVAMLFWQAPRLRAGMDARAGLEAVSTAASSDPANTTRRSGPAKNPRSTPEVEVESDARLDDLSCQHDRRQQFESQRSQIGADESPEQAIAHAFLTQFLALQTPEADQTAIGREYALARRRWPDSVDLAWLSTQHCIETRGCDWHAEWQHLQALDSDNAVVWMLEMASASQRKDDAAYDAALQRAVSASIHDSRSGTTFLHAYRVLAALPPPPSCLTPQHLANLGSVVGRPAEPGDWAAVFAGAMEAAVAAPWISALQGCQEKDGLLSPWRRQHCVTLLARVADSDTLLEQNLALGLLVRLTGDAPGHARLRERYRRLLWLMPLTAQLQLPDDFIIRMWTDGEVATLQSLAIAQGRWPPPPGWLPQAARHRALIQTGRPPPDER